MGESVTIRTPDGEFSAYVARPQRSPAPAIVVIQEIFGVNAVMRATAARPAAVAGAKMVSLIDRP